MCFNIFICICIMYCVYVIYIYIYYILFIIHLGYWYPNLGFIIFRWEKSLHEPICLVFAFTILNSWTSFLKTKQARKSIACTYTIHWSVFFGGIYLPFTTMSLKKKNASQKMRLVCFFLLVQLCGGHSFQEEHSTTIKWKDVDLWVWPFLAEGFIYTRNLYIYLAMFTSVLPGW